MADLKFTGTPSEFSTPPNGTTTRTTTSTEAGHTTALIQHVKLDTGDGTNTQPVSGTVSADPTAAAVVTGTISSSDGVADIINQVVTGYKSVSVQLTGTWAGTFTFAVTNDDTNWISLPVRDVSAVTTGYATTKAANGLYSANLPVCKTFRVRWTTATSGSPTATCYFSKSDTVQDFTHVILSGTNATNYGKAVDAVAGASDTGIASLVKRVTTPAAITPANGDYTTLQVDDNGKIWVAHPQPLTASAPAAATVGIASAQAVAANASRKGLILVNTSVSIISLGIGAAAVLYSGITLNANGGSFEMDQFSLSTGAINAIASGALSNLAVQEFA